MEEEGNFVTFNREGKILTRKECHELRTMGRRLHKGPGCSAVWDGELCWPSTSPGIITQHCPGIAPGAHSQAMAQCLMNGTWIRLGSREQNETFTNITKCFPEGTDTKIPVIYDFWVPVVKKISQVGYSCSLITLLLAFFVLFSSKKLRCPRNNLHLHLFASFILRATMNLLKGALFVDGLGMAADVQNVNGDLRFIKGRANWECKLITSIWQYAIMANYSWILAEGLYLHNLIFMALFTDSSSIALYVALGWGLPAVVVLPWVGGRLMYDDTYCWNMNENDNVQYLIKIPTIVTVLLSFGLFINIARVLLSKMLASVQVQRRELQYRRWARSTMVLVPLFGTHYALLLIFSVSGNDVVHVVWLLLDQTFASFQGALVALLYCLMTQEVRIELRRRWASAVTSIAGCRCSKKWCCCYKKSEARFLSSFRGGSLLHSGHGTNTGIVACQVRHLDPMLQISGSLEGVRSPDINAAPSVPGERPVGPMGPMGPDQNGGHAQSWV